MYTDTALTACISTNVHESINFTDECDSEITNI